MLGSLEQDTLCTELTSALSQPTLVQLLDWCMQMVCMYTVGTFLKLTLFALERVLCVSVTIIHMNCIHVCMVDVSYVLCCSPMYAYVTRVVIQ